MLRCCVGSKYRPAPPRSFPIRGLHTLARATRRLKRETLALCLAFRDERTPWGVRALIFGGIAYAFTPIDSVADSFQAVWWYLDSAFVVPICLALAILAVPAGVLAASRQQAASEATTHPLRTALIAFSVVTFFSGLALYLFFG